MLYLDSVSMRQENLQHEGGCVQNRCKKAKKNNVKLYIMNILMQVPLAKEIRKDLENSGISEEDRKTEETVRKVVQKENIVGEERNMREREEYFQETENESEPENEEILTKEKSAWGN